VEYFSKNFNGLRTLNLVTGSIALAISIISLLPPNLVIQILIYLLSFGLILIGTVRLAIGLFFSMFQNWIRVLFIIAGLFTITVPIFAFVFTDFGYLALVWLLSISFLSNGIVRFVQGITKTKKIKR
jgi:uncharacterized membrane protein HdeD (DUF308 family)